jgi:hypothetical protein
MPVKGNLSRSHAVEIAMLASAGEITAMAPAGNMGRLWVITPAGIRRYYNLRPQGAEGETNRGSA